jgi:hypothetical protein
VNTLTFIAEMTKALAWPTAIVVLSLIFRQHFGGLLEGVKLHRVQKGEWLADFETVAQEVRAELPGQGRIPSESAHTESPLAGETKRLIDLAPAAAVSQAWNQLEDRVIAAATSTGITQTRLPEVLRAMVDKGIIKPSVSDSILGLRNMRNLAVHAPADRLTQSQAREFVIMVEAIMWTLQQSLDRPAAAS